VLLAADCSPKWLTKHIPVIAALRNVPVLALKDNKGSSLRLGELVNVRTALAIGIKVGSSSSFHPFVSNISLCQCFREQLGSA
jgi:ribosomal protein L7Ae-like RNA K-turn-binding protein